MTVIHQKLFFGISWKKTPGKGLLFKSYATRFPLNSSGKTSNITSTGTLTFSSVSSGTNYFTVQIEGLSDGTVNASGTETATFTATALVKDSGGSTVLASATYHTNQQRMNPFG